MATVAAGGGQYWISPVEDYQAPKLDVDLVESSESFSSPMVLCDSYLPPRPDGFGCNEDENNLEKSASRLSIATESQKRPGESALADEETDEEMNSDSSSEEDDGDDEEKSELVDDVDEDSDDSDYDDEEEEEEEEGADERPRGGFFYYTGANYNPNYLLSSKGKIKKDWKLWEQYEKEMHESQGYDVKTRPQNCFDVTFIPWNFKADDKVTTLPEFRQMAEECIAYYNKKNHHEHDQIPEYEYVEVEHVTCWPCSIFRNFFITFRASPVGDPCSSTETFRAKYFVNRQPPQEREPRLCERKDVLELTWNKDVPCDLACCIQKGPHAIPY